MTTITGWKFVGSDEGTEAEVGFFLPTAVHEQIRDAGLETIFEAAAFETLMMAREREHLGIDDDDLPEIELPQGENEGVPTLYWISRNGDAFLVRPVETEFESE